MKPGPVAVIDLGTNTFHLLIAEKKSPDQFYKVYEEKFVAKIGKGGISKGILTPEAYARALEGLHYFRSLIDAYQISSDSVFATATSAIRNAVNGGKLIEEMYQQTGIHVQIISGDEEAELIYQGVRAAVDIGQQTSLIIDIGGGSVECIICNHAGILWKQSFEIGAQRLLDKFMHTDPISINSVQKLQAYLQEQLIPLANAVHQYAPKILIGAAGAFDTLQDIYVQAYGEQSVPEATEFHIPLSVFYQIHQQLLTLNRDERLAIPGMLEMRVDMMVVASCLIDFVVQTYQLTTIKVSAYALKEGLIRLKLQN